MIQKSENINMKPAIDNEKLNSDKSSKAKSLTLESCKSPNPKIENNQLSLKPNAAVEQVHNIQNSPRQSINTNENNDSEIEFNRFHCKSSKGNRHNEEDDQLVSEIPEYWIKENYEYYKPKISVELEEAENFKTTTEVHIKGWKIETPMMEVLTECFPHIECLNTIKYKRSFENKI